jgi:hypothetical protein
MVAPPHALRHGPLSGSSGCKLHDPDRETDATQECRAGYLSQRGRSSENSAVPKAASASSALTNEAVRAGKIEEWRGVPVGIPLEDLLAFDPPHRDMLECARSVNASLAGHGIRFALAEADRNLYFYGRFPFHTSLYPGRQPLPAGILPKQDGCVKFCVAQGSEKFLGADRGTQETQRSSWNSWRVSAGRISYFHDPPPLLWNCYPTAGIEYK